MEKITIFVFVLLLIIYIAGPVSSDREKITKDGKDGLSATMESKGEMQYATGSGGYTNGYTNRDTGQWPTRRTHD